MSSINGNERSQYIFTSESVSEGHPDKVCDQVSDAIVDACLRENPEARCGIETLASTNQIVIAGEFRGADSVTQQRMEELARGVIKDIGYEQKGFHWNTLKVANFVHQQSTDIAMGVDSGANKDEGAGDQGIMFGFACRETPELMPAALYYSHRILHALSQGRRSGAFKGLLPDAKSQVSLEYRNGTPVRAASVVVSTQHTPDMKQADIHALVHGVVKSVLPQGWLPADDQFFVNPTGQFIIGGPDGDSGLTGRKIIVDTYGGAAPHGGGAFSGKDPTKVDRSAAYVARYLAKKRGGFQPCGSLHHSAFLCDWCFPPCIVLCKHPWRGECRSGAFGKSAAGNGESHAAWPAYASEIESADLSSNRFVRPFWPRAR